MNPEEMEELDANVRVCSNTLNTPNTIMLPTETVLELIAMCKEAIIVLRDISSNGCELDPDTGYQCEPEKPYCGVCKATLFLKNTRQSK